MAEKVTFTSVIANAGFRYLWFNQILVQLAYNALNFALIIWVFKLVGTNLAVSALMLAIYLPAMLFGIFAGVFVDILDRRKIIILIDSLLALAFISLFFVKFSFPLILLVTFFINSLAQFFMPSESSSIPMLVTKRQLFMANSLFSLTLYGAFMLGFSLGGPILNHFGINAIFIFGAAALFSASIMARNLPMIKVSSNAKKLAKATPLRTLEAVLNLTVQEAKETFEFVRGKMQVAVSIGLMSAVQGIIGVLAVIMPSYMERVLKIHATDASYFVMLPLGLGMVSGALVIGRVCHKLPRRQVVIPAIIAAGGLLFIAGILPFLAALFQAADLPAYLTRPRYFFKAPSLSTFFALIAYLAGFAAVSIIVPCQTVIQEHTSEKNRGKIFAVLAVVMTAFSALPVILAGGLSDIFGVAPLLTFIGLGIMLVGFWAKYPQIIFRENWLPLKLKSFLGDGHWEGSNKNQAVRI